MSRQRPNRGPSGLPDWNFVSFPTFCGLAFGSTVATLVILVTNNAYFIWLVSLCALSFCIFHLITQTMRRRTVEKARQRAEEEERERRGLAARVANTTAQAAPPRKRRRRRGPPVT